MENTDIDNISFPCSTPSVSGIAPIVACTVALGMFATRQKNFSFVLNWDLNREIATPKSLKVSPKIIMNNAINPIEFRTVRSTRTPMIKNSNI